MNEQLRETMEKVARETTSREVSFRPQEPEGRKGGTERLNTDKPDSPSELRRERPSWFWRNLLDKAARRMYESSRKTCCWKRRDINELAMLRYVCFVKIGRGTILWARENTNGHS